jgi:hypothetical protein
MSLLDELSADLHAASDHLPLPTIRRAITDMRRANDKLLLAIRHTNNHPNRETTSQTVIPPVPRATLAGLGSATAHLENGAGLLMRAQDEVGTYLAAIGLHAPAVASARSTVPDVSPEAWWAMRVGMLTTEAGTACEDPARTSAELVKRVVAAVRSGDRATLHAQLVGAGAGIGSSLAGQATSEIRRLLTDAFGRPPTTADLPGLHDHTRLDDLLPRLPEGVVESVLLRVCHEAEGARHDAVDTAVGSGVLMARLICAFGREHA